MPVFTTTEGLRIHYERFGSQGPALVLLHGLGSSWEIWTPQIDLLSRYFQLYLFDYPGHGDSANTIQHTITRYTAILGEFMDTHSIGQAHLMGISLGCSVALTYGCANPERIASLVLQGPAGAIAPPWSPLAWPKILILLTYLLTLVMLRVILGKRRLVWLMNIVPVQTGRYHPLLARIELPASPLAKIALTLQSAYPPYIGKLRSITAPTLVIRGENDHCPIRYYQYVVDHVSGPSEMISIPGGKHVISLDNPEAYNQACLAFYRRILPNHPLLFSDV